jgi:energy-converting hydrogenase Eha subunit E
LVFLGKVTLSYLITLFLWAAPLSPDLLRSASAPLQDSNLYDFDAVTVTQYGLLSRDAPVTGAWLSFGIVRYIAAIYSVFGVSVIYVSMVNTLLVLMTFLALTALMHRLDGEGRIWQHLRWGLLLPFMSYYDATPAKEPLTNALYYVALLALVAVLSGRRLTVLRAMAVLVALGALSAVRANGGLLLLAANLPLLYRRFGYRAIAIGGGLVALTWAAVEFTTGSASSILQSMFNPDVWFGLLERNFSDRLASGENAAKLAVGSLLLPRGLTDLVALAPLRTAIWFMLPYPLVLPDLSAVANLRDLFDTDRLQYFTVTQEVLAQVNAWLIVAAVPFIVAVIVGSLKRPRSGQMLLVLNLLVPALAAANVNFVMGRRYRILIEPLMFATAIWGARYCHTSQRWRLAWYAAAVVGVIAFAIYSGL